ncbi:MAG: hypothetical protein LBI60_01520 [Bacteroidales bacterium]|nr:hypothetical protein [Bacteroidales bacterium]
MFCFLRSGSIFYSLILTGIKLSQELFDAGKAKQYIQNRYHFQRSTKEQQEREITVYEDGQAYRLWVSEPKIAASINREISEDLPSILKTIKALTNMRTGVMTKYNPNFAMRNFTRDLQTAGISNMGTGLNPLFLANFGNPKMHAAIWRHMGLAANGSKSVGSAMTDAITYSVGESLPLDILDFLEWDDTT